MTSSVAAEVKKNRGWLLEILLELYRTSRWSSMRRLRKWWNKVPTQYSYNDVRAWQHLNESERTVYENRRVFLMNEYLETLESIEFRERKICSDDEAFREMYPWKPWENNFEYAKRMQALPPEEQVEYWKRKYQLSEDRRQLATFRDGKFRMLRRITEDKFPF